MRGRGRWEKSERMKGDEGEEKIWEDKGRWGEEGIQEGGEGN